MIYSNCFFKISDEWLTANAVGIGLDRDSQGKTNLKFIVNEFKIRTRIGSKQNKTVLRFVILSKILLQFVFVKPRIFDVINCCTTTTNISYSCFYLIFFNRLQKKEEDYQFFGDFIIIFFFYQLYLSEILGSKNFSFRWSKSITMYIRRTFSRKCASLGSRKLPRTRLNISTRIIAAAYKVYPTQQRLNRENFSNFITRKINGLFTQSVNVSSFRGSWSKDQNPLIRIEALSLVI